MHETDNLVNLVTRVSPTDGSFELESKLPAFLLKHLILQLVMSHVSRDSKLHHSSGLMWEKAAFDLKRTKTPELFTANTGLSDNNILDIM